MDSILEIRHLKGLQSLKQAGSVSLAAKQLHLTQSALSHQIRALEEYYGCILFERKSKPICFTPEGKKLLQLADRLLPQIRQTEAEITQLKQGDAGELRIAVECHTCFDWLMPAMDSFRHQWLSVELDIVSGFQADPVGLLLTHQADLAIVSEYEPQAGITYHPLFSHEILVIAATHHPLSNKPIWYAKDFINETLITYPVPDDMLDLLKQVLLPNNIHPKRRHSELTIAIIQLVASQRGIAALPQWAVIPYLEKGYVVARQITDQGLHSNLYAAVRESDNDKRYLAEFCDIIREGCFRDLPGLRTLTLPS